MPRSKSKSSSRHPHFHASPGVPQAREELLQRILTREALRETSFGTVARISRVNPVMPSIWGVDRGVATQRAGGFIMDLCGFTVFNMDWSVGRHFA